MSLRYTPRSFRTATPLYLAFLLLFLSLLVSYVSGYVLYLKFRAAKTEEVKSSLFQKAQLSHDKIAESLSYTLIDLEEEDRNLVFANFKDDSEWIRWFEKPGGFSEEKRKAIRALKLMSHNIESSSVLLISPQKRIILDASGEQKPGAPAPLSEDDQAAWESSLTGEPGSFTPLERDGKPFIRVFYPIRIPEGRFLGSIGAILMIETDIEGYSKIKDWKRLGFVMAAIIAALSATIALLFYRLMRNLVKVRETAAHSDRLQAMGTLTAGISHEIRNPLGIIRALAEGMRGDFDRGDPRREMADDIIDEVQRLNELVNQYLQFARPTAAKPDEQAWPDEIIRTIALLLEKGDKGSPPIKIEISEKIPPVLMNESALRQVLLNLLMNAMEASEEDGLITIKCSTLRARSQVQIVVSDSGSGIAPRDLRRVFDPFYTTRHHGTGLGLPICRQLITECRGKIQIESAPGEGTTLRITLPTGEEPAEKNNAETIDELP